MGQGLVGRGQGGRGLVGRGQGDRGQGGQGQGGRGQGGTSQGGQGQGGSSQASQGLGGQVQVHQLQRRHRQQGLTFTNVNIFPLLPIYPQTDAEIPEFTKKPHRYRSLPPMCKIERMGWVSFIY